MHRIWGTEKRMKNISMNTWHIIHLWTRRRTSAYKNQKAHLEIKCHVANRTELPRGRGQIRLTFSMLIYLWRTIQDRKKSSSERVKWHYNSFLEELLPVININFLICQNIYSFSFLIQSYSFLDSCEVYQVQKLFFNTRCLIFVRRW
jgi:hypothetical protein